MVGGALGYAAIPSFRAAVGDAVKQIRLIVSPEYVPVHVAGKSPDGRAVAGHPAAMAFDGKSGTYWAAPAGAASPSIVAYFEPPATVAKVLVTSGASDGFLAQPRPHKVRLEFLDARGKPSFAHEYELLDAKEAQTLDVEADGASAFRITVLSVYASTEGANVAITEIEFRARQ